MAGLALIHPGTQEEVHARILQALPPREYALSRRISLDSVQS
jgi:hypothetical protein